MTKTFDEICKGILGEMITTPNQQQKPNPNQPQQPAQKPGQTPAPGAGAPAAIQNNVQNNTPQQTPDELTKAFETLNKHAANNQDQIKAIAALQQLLTAQQQNAANQPVQKA